MASGDSLGVGYNQFLMWCEELKAKKDASAERERRARKERRLRKRSKVSKEQELVAKWARVAEGEIEKTKAALTKVTILEAELDLLRQQDPQMRILALEAHIRMLRGQLAEVTEKYDRETRAHNQTLIAFKKYTIFGPYANDEEGSD